MAQQRVAPFVAGDSRRFCSPKTQTGQFPPFLTIIASTRAPGYTTDASHTQSKSSDSSEEPFFLLCNVRTLLICIFSFRRARLNPRQRAREAYKI